MRIVRAVMSSEYAVRGGLLLGGVVAGYLAGEVLVRMLPPTLLDPSAAAEAKRRICWKTDTVVHHLNCPDFTGFNTNAYGEFAISFTTNSMGLLNRETTHAKPARTQRILVLGDSMVEAMQVSMHERFTSLLEDSLNERAVPIRYEVINAGTSSYSPLVEYVYLRTMGLRFNPDLVIVVLASNDVRDDAFYATLAVWGTDGMPERIPFPQPKSGIWLRLERRLRSRLQFYNFLRTTGARLWQRYVAGPDDIVDDRTPREREAWEITRRALKGIKELAYTGGVKLLVVSVPVNTQVSDEPVGNFYPDRLRIRGTRLQELIARICLEEEIPFLDLLPYFATAQERPLFFPYDGHLTPVGHRMLARVLTSYLETAGLLDNLRSRTGKIPRAGSANGTESRSGWLFSGSSWGRYGPQPVQSAVSKPG